MQGVSGSPSKTAHERPTGLYFHECLCPVKCVDGKQALLDRAIPVRSEFLVELCENARGLIKEALHLLTEAKDLDQPLHLDKQDQMESILKEWTDNKLGERLEAEKRGCALYINL